MKKLAIVLSTAVLLITVVAISALAQGSIPYIVGIQIKNLDNSNTAPVSVRYYNKDNGELESSFEIPNGGIPPGDSFTMATLQGVSDGFDGSAVITSDFQIAAIANVFGNGFSGMGASYTAFTAGATNINLPLILRNHFGFTTWFNVQNASPSNESTTVTVTYNNGESESRQIQPGAAWTFNQADISNLLPDPYPAPNDAGFVGSATITSDNNVPIVASLLQQGPTTLLGYDSFRDSQASTNPVMPLVNSNNFGFITGIQIQNIGTINTEVTISYTASLEGNNCTETKSVLAESSTTFAANAFRITEADENCADGETFIGSATVTSNSANQPLVAIVNQLNNSTNKGAAYGAFNPANGTSTVELPLIMDRNFDYYTGYSIANVGTTEVNITCTYTGSPDTPSNSTTNPLPPGGAFTIVNLNQLGNPYVGAATCLASNNNLVDTNPPQIVGIVNELNSNATSDSFLVYEGTNR